VLGVLRRVARAVARERTSAALLGRGVLARFAFALDLRRERDDVARADLREM